METMPEFDMTEAEAAEQWNHMSADEQAQATEAMQKMLPFARVLNRLYESLAVPDESITVWFERSLPDRRRIMRAKLATLRAFIDRIEARLDEREARDAQE
jgi:hypothetical protein